MFGDPSGDSRLATECPLRVSAVMHPPGWTGPCVSPRLRPAVFRMWRLRLGRIHGRGTKWSRDQSKLVQSAKAAHKDKLTLCGASTCKILDRCIRPRGLANDSPPAA